MARGGGVKGCSGSGWQLDTVPVWLGHSASGQLSKSGALSRQTGLSLLVGQSVGPQEGWKSRGLGDLGEEFRPTLCKTFQEALFYWGSIQILGYSLTPWVPGKGRR